MSQVNDADFIDLIEGPTTNSRIDLLSQYYTQKKDSWGKYLDWESADFETPAVDYHNWSPYFKFFQDNKIDKNTVSLFNRDLLKTGLSNLLAGERVAIITLGDLIAKTEDLKVKGLCIQQASEEFNHIEVLTRYLVKAHDGISEINPYMKKSYDLCLEDHTIDMKFLSLQILLEPVASSYLAHVRNHAQNSFLKSLLKKIMTEEERHIAIGVFYLNSLRGSFTQAELNVRSEYILSFVESLVQCTISELNPDNYFTRSQSVEFRNFCLQDQELQRGRTNAFKKLVHSIYQSGFLTKNVQTGLEKMELLRP